MGDSRKKEHKSASQAKDAGQHQITSFVDGAGIDREVIATDICRYLGNDAFVRPGEYTDKISGRAQQGFFITAYRPPTSAQLQDIRYDSAKWQEEKRRNQLRGISLRDSDTSSQDKDKEEWSNWEWLPEKDDQLPHISIDADYTTRVDHAYGQGFGTLVNKHEPFQRRVTSPEFGMSEHRAALKSHNATDNSGRASGIINGKLTTNCQDTPSSQLKANCVEDSLVDSQQAYSVTKNAESADPLRDAANARMHHLPTTILDTVGSTGITSLNEDQFLVAAIGGGAAIVLGVANTGVSIANCLSARKSAKAAELSAKVAADKLAFEKEEAAAKRIAEAKADSASQDSGQAGQGSSDLAAPVQTMDGVTVNLDTNGSTTNRSQTNDSLSRSIYTPSHSMTRMARATQASPSKVLMRRQLKNVEEMLEKIRKRKAPVSRVPSQNASKHEMRLETNTQKQREDKLDRKLTELRRNQLLGCNGGESSGDRDSNKTDQPDKVSPIPPFDDDHSGNEAPGTDIKMNRLSLLGKESKETRQR